MIRIQGLVKKYPSVTAVNDLNLSVPAGELFGFLGPNGAGKTTTIKLLMGLLKPTSGTITIGGVDCFKDPVKAKAMVGYIPDRPYLYEKLTGWEYLEFISGLFGVDSTSFEARAVKFLDFFDLKDTAGQLIEGFSHGMKQKLIISGALIHDPRVLVVDEPLVGLDPKGARQVKDLFQDLCRKGVTVFMSTHSMAVAEAMCHRIGIIQQGRMVALGTVEELRVLANKEHGALEDIFLKLTGEDDLKPLWPSLQNP